MISAEFAANHKIYFCIVFVELYRRRTWATSCWQRWAGRKETLWVKPTPAFSNLWVFKFGIVIDVTRGFLAGIFPCSSCVWSFAVVPLVLVSWLWLVQRF